MKRRLALLTALVAVLAGGATVALGSSGGKTKTTHSGKRALLLGVAAAYLDVPQTQLRSELHSGKSLAQIAEADSGHSSGGLIAALVGARSAHLSERITTLVSRPGDTRQKAGGHARSSARTVALAYLDLSPAQVRTQLQAGKSLGEIADATPGRSASGLIDAILANAAKRLGPKTATGHLSKSAQTARMARIRKRVSAVVARKHVTAKPTH
jgi:hypothetical protein